jgi:hypothetical protein
VRSITAVAIVAVGCEFFALSAPPTASADDDFVALAISAVTGRALGWGVAGSQDGADQIAIAHCHAEAGDVCQAVAGMHNGCASVAFDPASGRFQGGSGPDTTASNADALAKLGSRVGRIKASHCSS